LGGTRPANKTWAAWKTAYHAAHKKRADHLRATGGADYLGQANSAHTTTLNPDLLDSIDNALDNLASAATNKKAILEQLIASDSSLATSNSTLVTNLWPSPGVAAEGGAAAMTQTRRGDLTLQATAGLSATVLDVATPATPAPISRKATSPPPCVTTSWAVSSPTRTGRPTGPPEGLGRTYQLNLSLLRPLIY
jgi:hypothetical protein